MTNIELFDKTAAHYFALLYERFPMRETLEGDAVIQAIAKEFSPAEKAEWNDKLRFFGFESAAWLVRHGYIEHNGANGLNLFECALTPKGLDAMRVVPNSIKGGESVGDMLRSGVRDGIRHKVSEAIGIVVGEATRRVFAS